MNTQERRYPVILESIVHDAVSNLGFKLKKVNTQENFIVLERFSGYLQITVRWSNQSKGLFGVRIARQIQRHNQLNWIIVVNVPPIQLMDKLKITLWD